MHIISINFSLPNVNRLFTIISRLVFCPWCTTTTTTSTTHSHLKHSNTGRHWFATSPYTDTPQLHSRTPEQTLWLHRSLHLQPTKWGGISDDFHTWVSITARKSMLRQRLLPLKRNVTHEAASMFCFVWKRIQSQQNVAGFLRPLYSNLSLFTKYENNSFQIQRKMKSGISVLSTWQRRDTSPCRWQHDWHNLTQRTPATQHRLSYTTSSYLGPLPLLYIIRKLTVKRLPVHAITLDHNCKQLFTLCLQAEKNPPSLWQTKMIESRYFTCDFRCTTMIVPEKWNCVGYFTGWLHCVAAHNTQLHNLQPSLLSAHTTKSQTRTIRE